MRMKEEKQPKFSASAKRQVGISLIIISSVLLFFCIFGLPGDVRDFFLGVFGLMIYPLLLFMLLFGVAFTLEKRFVYSVKYVLYLMLVFFFFVCVLHIFFTGFSGKNLSYGDYLLSTYHSRFTPGGLFVGLFTFPLMSLLHDVAAVVTYGIALVISLYFVFSYLGSLKQMKLKTKNNSKYENFEKEEEIFFPKSAPSFASASENIPTIASVDDDIFVKEEKEESPEVEQAKRKLGLKKEEAEEEIEQQEESPKSRLFGKSSPDAQRDAWSNRAFSKPQKFVYEGEKTEPKPNPVVEENRKYLKTIQDRNNINENPIINAENYEDYKEKMRQFQLRNTRELSRQDDAERKTISEPDEDVLEADFFGIEPEREISEEFDLDIDFIKPDGKAPKISPLNPLNFGGDASGEEPKRNASERFLEEKREDGEEDAEQVFNDDAPQRKFNFNVLGGAQKVVEPNFKYDSRYVAPSVELLKTYRNDQDYEENFEENIEALERVLEEFRIPAKVMNVRRGAAVTRYELHMPVGIPVRKIQAHSSDIALALAAKSDIRIEAPIKGKSAVGIEVPNSKVDTIGLKDIIQSEKFADAKAPLVVALGKDVDGNVYVGNLAKMPHLLVAGSTGSGKSVCLNALILSLIYRTSPEDLRLILIDPKRVEFAHYNKLPHLLMPKVITEPKKALNAFDWLIDEMERRFMVFQSCSVRNIIEYNSQSDVTNKRKPKIPYIVLIVDELADLVVTTNKRELEEKIIRLTQKARAAGIHLILATQRPSVDIITGSIKINLPTRIAFAVTNYVDSRTILDQGGAEKLLGRGDMLYAPNDGEPVRVQGAFVDTPEVKVVVDFVKQNNPSFYDDNVNKNINAEGAAQGGLEGMYGGANKEVDPIMPDALKHVIELGQASTSMLQRRFSLGFQRAARIVDQMEQAGFISASDGSKPRAVYMTMDDYNKYYGLK